MRNIFVGDFTAVQKIYNEHKDLLDKEIFFRYPTNCNVYGEYNRALGKYEDFWQQIILVMNTVNGDPYDDATIIPIDTRECRFPISFSLTDFSKENKKTVQQELVPLLVKTITSSVEAALEN